MGDGQSNLMMNNLLTMYKTCLFMGVMPYIFFNMTDFIFNMNLTLKVNVNKNIAS